MDPRIARKNLRRLERAARALEAAVGELAGRLPLAPEAFDPDALPPRETLLLDGFRARYGSLQDLLGAALFKTVALLDEDETPARPLTTRQRIALMAKRGLLDEGRWRELREIRNRFAHEYPEEHRTQALNLNAAWESVPELLGVARAVADYLRHHPGLGGS